MIKLRNYQQEVVDLINNIEPGKYLISMATGLGKTVVFTHLNRQGRVLVLAHREELIFQPAEHYKRLGIIPGIEMAKHNSSGEEVVIASVQSIVRRLDKFSPEDFDMIIVDEAHHSVAPTYRKILDYFKPRLVLGFTATPNRGDNIGLKQVFDKIIYQKDIKWAISNEFLVDIECLRVNVGYDISQVARRLGDFAIGELATAMNIDRCNKAILEAYNKYRVGKTLIFAVNVEHALALAEIIPNSKAVVGTTKDRTEIVEEFKNGDLDCLVNCMIFTEGTDIPNIETIMIARPTQNSSLYTQMVGRGLRLHADKEKLRLIDLVGTTGRADICSAPTLIGIDMRAVAPEHLDKIEAESLFDLEEEVKLYSDKIESWVENARLINLWARENKYKLHDINFFKTVSGELLLSIPNRRFRIPKPDELGLVNGIPYQQLIDNVYEELVTYHSDAKTLWSKSAVNRWGKSPATPNQYKYIQRLYDKHIPTGLNKQEANYVINRLKAGDRK